MSLGGATLFQGGSLGATVPSAYLYRASSLGGADDSANIADLIDGGVRNLQFADGQTFAWGSVLDLVSNLSIVGGRGSGIVSTIAPVDGFSASCFYATKSGVGSTNDLTESAVMGTNTVKVTSAVTVGAWIALSIPGSGNLQQIARVKATANSGKTLTLDRVIRYAYFTTGNSAAIYVFTPITDVLLDFRGMRIGGPCDRYVELAFTERAIVRGLHVDNTLATSTATSFQFGIDIGCAYVAVEDCHADGGGGLLSGTNGAAGFSRESGIGLVWRNNTARGFGVSPGYGFATLDCKGGSQEGCYAERCTVGQLWGANDSAGTEGTEDDVRSVSTALCTTGYQADKASVVRVHGMTSLSDTTTIDQLGGTPAVEIAGFRFVAPASGTYNGTTLIPGSMTWTDGVLDFTQRTSGNKALCDLSGAGTFRLRGVRVSSGATGTFGLYLEDAYAHTIIIGADVDLGNVGTPLHLGSTSKVRASQSGVLGVVTTGGATSLTWAQSLSAAIEVTGALGSDAAIAPVYIPGCSYIVRNSTSGAHAVTFAGVAVTQGKTATIRITSAAAGAAATGEV